MTDTVFDAFAASAKRHPGNEFLFIPESATAGWANRRIVYTYAEAADEIEALRARYAAAGVGPGHRIAILLENRDSFFFA